ncbi:hypothetical protein [Alteromonas macleodii]|uniref:hypothetical protein n=1 Tax=Alteromonas macleodii TaxID=28108 RepID=UPI0001AEBCFA|nr:hypothetical protein [Alteromonas macleodii]AFS37292.1 hypothetical protein MASE_08805 [Alteromonas macleodii ATCC 27126]
MNDIVVKEDVNLPALPNTVLPAIAELTAAFGIPREVLASQEEIEYAWRDLPRELREIPGDLRGELIARILNKTGIYLFWFCVKYTKRTCSPIW